MRGVLAPKVNKHVIIGSALIAVFSIFLFVFVSSYWGDTYSVSGESMNPTLHDGERIKIATTGEPAADDMVVFEQQEQWPQYDVDKHGRLVIKRIVGIKGDTITLANNVLKVNGYEAYKLPESYECEVDSFVDVIPAGRLFVLGDNTENSRDSLRALCLGGQDPYVHMGDVHTWGTSSSPFNYFMREGKIQ